MSAAKYRKSLPLRTFATKLPRSSNQTAAQRKTEETKQPSSGKTQLTRRQYSGEEKVRIVIAGMRREESIVELCRKEGINQNLYYRWNNEFLEAGKKRLAGNVPRQTSDRELRDLRAEAAQLKHLLGELLLENRLLKKKVRRDRESDH